MGQGENKYLLQLAGGISLVSMTRKEVTSFSTAPTYQQLEQLTSCNIAGFIVTAGYVWIFALSLQLKEPYNHGLECHCAF